MEFYGYIGCLEQEKMISQRYLVTVAMDIDHIKAAETDLLEDTVDYSEVFEIAKAVISTESMNLIEHAAGRIAEEIKLRFDGIDKVSVTVSKPDAPIDGVFETMEVTVER